MENIAAGNVSGNFNSGGNLCAKCKRTIDGAQARSRLQLLCRRFNPTCDVRVESVLNASATIRLINVGTSLAWWNGPAGNVIDSAENLSLLPGLKSWDHYRQYCICVAIEFHWKQEK